MRATISIGLAAALLSYPASAQQSGLHPPPIRSGGYLSEAAPSQTYITETEQRLTCGGVPVTPVAAESPAPILWAGLETARAVATAPFVLLVDFTIDQTGRTQDIRMVPGPVPPPGPASGYATQTQAALAASLFAPQARTDCRLEQSFRLVPLAEASAQTLAEALAAGWTPQVSSLRTAISRPGDDCARPWPLVAHHTPRRSGSPRAGTTAWSVVRHDIRPDGVAADAQVLASSGDADFNAATLKATASTVFESDRPLNGCLRTFRNVGPDLPAPPMPSPVEDPLRNCPADVAASFTPGRMTYPAAFSARGIEGWVLVRFDAASWGAIGAVHAIEAQPADAFRTEAENMVRNGRVTPGFRGGVRCVIPIRFEMGGDDSARVAPVPPAPF